MVGLQVGVQAELPAITYRLFADPALPPVCAPDTYQHNMAVLASSTDKYHIDGNTRVFGFKIPQRYMVALNEIGGEPVRPLSVPGAEWVRAWVWVWVWVFM